jgi:hypothetical protein
VNLYEFATETPDDELHYDWIHISTPLQFRLLNGMAGDFRPVNHEGDDQLSKDEQRMFMLFAHWATQ